MLINVMKRREAMDFKKMEMEELTEKQNQERLNRKCITFFNKILHGLSEKSLSIEPGWQLDMLNKIKHKLQKCRYTLALDFVDDMWEVESCFRQIVKPDKSKENNEDCDKSYMSIILQSMEEEFKRELKACCFRSRKVAPWRNCYKCIGVIPENVQYYQYGQDDQTWDICEPCYKSYKGKFMVLLLQSNSNECFNVRVRKNKWRKYSNVANYNEKRVICYICHQAYHRVCVHYINVCDVFCCQYCTSAQKIIPEIQATNAINDLPENDLTKFIEARVNNRCIDHRKVFVRLISSLPKTHVVSPRLKLFFDKQGISSSFPYMSKFLACFQESSEKGNVLMFFGLYTQEYGSMCPPPNRNCVYIGILDSVRVIKSYTIRRSVLFGVITSYLYYLQHRGFEKAFLWVCPPRPGVEYIFQRRPFDQSNPTFRKLGSWYKRMMETSKRMGVLEEYGLLDDLCGGNETNFRSLPYFHEDHWPDKLEEILTQFDKVGVKRPNKKIKLEGKTAIKVENEGDPEVTTVMEKMLCALKSLRESFYYMKFSRPAQPKTDLFKTMLSEEIVSSKLVNDRDDLVAFFKVNGLEFRDSRKIVYTTKFLLANCTFDVLNCSCCQSLIVGEFGFHCCLCRATCCSRCKHQHSDCDGCFLGLIIKSEAVKDDFVERQNPFRVPEYEYPQNYHYNITSPISVPASPKSIKTSGSDDDYSEEMEYSDNAMCGPSLIFQPNPYIKLLCK